MIQDQGREAFPVRPDPKKEPLSWDPSPLSTPEHRKQEIGDKGQASTCSPRGPTSMAGVTLTEPEVCRAGQAMTST